MCAIVCGREGRRKKVERKAQAWEQLKENKNSALREREKEKRHTLVTLHMSTVHLQAV